ncbi:MAG: disulfide reductase [Chlorobi bacterium]|nr:disulfide reductase [Chlorobiota bacterium]
MTYAYYPGCSLESSSRMYDSSLREVFRCLDLELVELEDWNCCGATAYFSVKETVSLAVSARNLALAERAELDIVAPCSSCFTILLKTHHMLEGNTELSDKINEALGAVNLSYKGNVRVRHPLEVLVNDVGLEKIRDAVKVPLDGFAIAPYYGCQIARGESSFDDSEDPVFMDRLFSTLGARLVYFPHKVRCCGGMLMYTWEDIAVRLVADLMRCAQENGAHLILTTCPMCHANLDLHLEHVRKVYPEAKPTSTYFFTQLLGLALGIPAEKLGFDLNYIPIDQRLKDLIQRTTEVTHA